MSYVQILAIFLILGGGLLFAIPWIFTKFGGTSSLSGTLRSTEENPLFHIQKLMECTGHSPVDLVVILPEEEKGNVKIALKIEYDRSENVNVPKTS